MTITITTEAISNINEEAKAVLSTLVGQEVEKNFLLEMVGKEVTEMLEIPTAKTEIEISVNLGDLIIKIAPTTKTDQKFVGKTVTPDRLTRSSLVSLCLTLGALAAKPAPAPVAKPAAKPALVTKPAPCAKPAPTRTELFRSLGLDKSLSEKMKTWLKGQYEGQTANRWSQIIIKPVDSGVKVQVNWPVPAHRTRMYKLIAEAARAHNRAHKIQTRHIWIAN